MIQIIIALAIVIVSIAGYVLNIVGIANTIGFTGLLVLRVLGIFFPPLGVILGFV